MSDILGLKIGIHIFSDNKPQESVILQQKKCASILCLVSEALTVVPSTTWKIRVYIFSPLDAKLLPCLCVGT